MSGCLYYVSDVQKPRSTLQSLDFVLDEIKACCLYIHFLWWGSSFKGSVFFSTFNLNAKTVLMVKAHLLVVWFWILVVIIVVSNLRNLHWQVSIMPQMTLLRLNELYNKVG